MDAGLEFMFSASVVLPYRWHLCYIRSMASSAVKFYTVWEGRRPGVYNTWEECKRQVEGFPGAKYRSFTTRREAESAFNDHHSRHLFRNPGSAGRSHPAKTRSTGVPLAGSLCVDAACSGNPGALEYRGVEASTGQEIFKMGPYPEGTNNIGEFLAIVHALALLQKQSLHQKVIYSDSVIAIGWVKKKKCGTKLQMTKRNSLLFDLIHRAESWLERHTYQNPILKWETEAWGEIPADFGRK